MKKKSDGALGKFFTMLTSSGSGNSGVPQPQKSQQKPPRGKSPAIQGKTVPSVKRSVPIVQKNMEFQVYDTSNSTNHEIEERIRSIKSPLLSGQGGSFSLSQEEREICVIFNDGTMVVASGQKFTSKIEVITSRLRKINFRIKTQYRVNSLSLIADIYERNRESIDYLNRSDSDNSVKLSHKLLLEAIRKGASDIHIIVGSKETRIELRVQGLIFEQDKITSHEGENVLRAFFNKCTTKPVNYEPRNKPMNANLLREGCPDGFVPKEIRSCRLSYTPQGMNSTDGLQLVIRVFYTDGGRARPISSFGFRREQIRQLAWMRRQTEGIILTSGPTGSGKSSLSASMLEADYADHNGQISIQTAEDPVEMTINGAVQFNVLDGKNEEEKRANYNALLHSLLRNDPDVIMLSEVRGESGASAVFRMAMSGHRVYTTVHAASAAMIVPRLVDLGVLEANATEPTLVIGLIGQRLIRQICPDCSISLTELQADDSLREEVLAHNLHVQEQDRLNFFNFLVKLRDHARSCAVDGIGMKEEERDVKFLLPHGHERIKNADERGYCKKCNGTGASGRQAIIEIVLPDREYMNILKGENIHRAMDYWLNNLNGMLLREHAIQKMVEGLVSPQDVIFAVGNIDRWDMVERGKKVFGEFME